MKRYIRKNIAMVLTVAVLCTFLAATVACASTIDQYEAQIEANITQINNLEELKESLHATAELLRANDYINHDFDSILGQKWFECNDYQVEKENENEELQAEINRIKEEQNKKKFVGNFKITHYCPCSICNGSWGNKTALGTTLTPYRTIAVDPKVIPLGSKVEINGKTYIAEDTGGAIKGYRIDMCVASHSEAYRKGVLTNVPVYIVK